MYDFFLSKNDPEYLKKSGTTNYTNEIEMQGKATTLGIKIYEGCIYLQIKGCMSYFCQKMIQNT